MNLDTLPELRIVQRRELTELLGVETRNKYELRDSSGTPLGFAAEQGKGLLELLLRNFMGHWRTFDILVFDQSHATVMRAHHPFRFFMQRLEVFDPNGRLLGALQQRFSLFRRFDVEDERGEVVLQMRAPLLKVWTFPFFRGEDEVGRIEKKWTGLLKEAFTDSDNFRVDFGRLKGVERWLVLAAALFVDLQYFERKAE